MLLSLFLLLGGLALAALAHLYVHGLARHLMARALGVKGTRMPLAIADREAYRTSPLGRRLAAAAAGPVANYLLCALTFLAAGAVAGTQEPSTRIERVMSGGPAEQAGLRAGDLVLAVDGKRLTAGSQISETVRARGAGPLEIEIERAGERQSLTAEVRDGRIGIMLATDRRPVSAGVAGRAVVLPAETMLRIAGQLVHSSAELAGPVGIAHALGAASDLRGQIASGLLVLASYSAMAWPLSVLLAFLGNRART